MQVEYYHEFIVLAEEQNYRKAAKRLCIAQSTLSKHISALESHYHVRLVDRRKPSIDLTSHGQVLLESALAIWNEYKKSVRLVGKKEEEQRGLYIAGILDSPGAFSVVSATVNEFMKDTGARPPHLIPCTTATADKLAGLVTSGEADIAVFYFDDETLKELPGCDDLKRIPVCNVPLDARVSSKSDLARKSEITANDLAGRTLIRLVGPRFTSAWAQIESRLNSLGIPFTSHPVAAFSYYDYVNIAPRDAVLLVEHSNDPEPDGQTRVPVDEESLSLSLGALALKDGADRNIGLFVDLLSKHYRP